MLFTGREVRPWAVLETEGTVFPNTDRSRPVNNISIYFKFYFYKVGETIKKNWKSHVFILHFVSSTCQQMYNKIPWFFYEKVEQ